MTTQTAPQRILVVEDSKVIQRLIEVSLRSLEAEIDMVGNGAAGLQSVDESRPDVVVLDIGLPGIDGWGVLAELQADASTRDLPVVMLTGHAELFTETDAVSRGATSFMTKPFHPSELRSQVSEILGAA